MLNTHPSSVAHKPQTAYIAFAAHFIVEGDDHITSTTLSCEECPGSHTAEHRASSATACLQRYGIEDTAITFTTDIAANVKKACNSLEQEWHSCAAHKVELALKPILTDGWSVKETFAQHNKAADHLKEFDQVGLAPTLQPQGIRLAMLI